MNCHCSQSGLGALARVYGLGALRLPPMWPGDLFKFGYNVGYISGPFSVAGIANALEAAGITYNTRSYHLAGTLNPFVAVEGASNVYWDSATDLREEIINIIKGAGYPIQVGSIQFEAETHAEEAQPPAVVRQDDPGVSRASGGSSTTPGQSIFDSIAAGLDMPKSDAKALVIGGSVVVGILLLKK